jgi:hypothetical protein
VFGGANGIKTCFRQPSTRFFSVQLKAVSHALNRPFQPELPEIYLGAVGQAAG